MATLRTEPGADANEGAMALSLLASADHAILSGDVVDVIAGVMGYRADTCADGAREVREQMQALLSRYRRLADRLDLSRAVEPDADVSIEALRQAALGCLRRLQADGQLGKGPMAVVMASEWARDLVRQEADLEPAVSAAVQAAQRPWWR
jgi:hypothetical protein